MEPKINNYHDFRALNQLEHDAKQNKDAALPIVAKQFEAVFLQQVLKSMRSANESIKSELFSSNSADFYQDMYDQQIALTMSNGKGIGLAEVIVKQLSLNKTD